MAQGQLGPALEAYRASLGIAERLSKADPGNAGWQRDPSVSNFKIGKSLVDQNRAEEASPYLEAALAIAEDLARRDPSNATWQKDAEVSRGMVARLKQALGRK